MKVLILTLSFFIGATNAPANSNAKNFFNDKTKIENPFNLRDPFKAPQAKGESRRQGRGYQVTGKGQYSNITETALDQLNVQNLKVVGVLIGKERRAMISVGSNGKANRVIILKEGMKIGQDNSELKAILPGGIVLVEKIVNVYGEEEYLETVIPISK
jgi:type IV pilus assembly protein PilP